MRLSLAFLIALVAAAGSTAGAPAIPPSDRAFALPATPDSALTPESVAAEMDAHYYYPQRHGLSTLRARVRVASLDSVFAKQGLEPPPIEFIWSAPSVRRFVVGPSPSAELREQVVSLLEGRGETIVPKPLAETVNDYGSQFIRTRGDTILLAVSSPRDTSIEMRSFRALIVRPAWRLLRFGAGSARGPISVQNDFQQVNDQNVLSRMLVHYGDLSVLVKVDRVPVGGFWLVSRIAYKFKGGTLGNTPSAFDIVLDDFRVNETIPDSLLGG